MSQKFTEAMKSFPTAESLATSKYYRGGFDAKMNKREAALILGVSPTASKTKVWINEFSKILKDFLYNFMIFLVFILDKGCA